jgi:hypothetical protein
MTGRQMERALWSCAALAASGGLLGVRAARPRAGGPVMALPVVATKPAAPAGDALDSAVADIADRNLFRPERASAEERESSAAAPAMAMGAPSSKPHLVLKGVLGGPPWDAVLEGIPGREGAVVIRAGESVGGVSVRAIRRDTAYVRGFDTTWALPLSRTW